MESTSAQQWQGDQADPAFKLVFGRVLRRLRQAGGITQEKLEWDSGVSRVYISQAERGLRNPSCWVILQLAPPLGLSGAEMLMLIEEEYRRERPRPESDDASARPMKGEAP